MEPRRPRLPLWLKLAYTAFMLVWVPVYWVKVGPANFLWLCDIANFFLLVALWRESALLASSQAVGVLFIQLVWCSDFFSRLLSGNHLLGGTEYMFDPQEHVLMRSLSLFHVFVPVLLVFVLRRLGFDRRGIRLQTAITWIVLPLSFLPDPERNLNWVWEPFGKPQTLMPPAAYLAVCMVLYPLVIYLPTHLALARTMPGAGRGVLGSVLQKEH